MLRRIAITVFLVATIAAAPASAGVMLDKVVAVVNDEAITWGELYKAMEFEFARNLTGLSYEEKRKIFGENEERFLENMINMKLQLQEAHRLGIFVMDAEIDKTIQGIRQKYSLDDAAFADSLRREGFSMSQYREKLREQMIISRLIEKQLRSKIVITEEDLADASSDAYYHIRQIFLKNPEDGDEEALQARAAEIITALEAGEAFAKLAIKHSDGADAVDGGDLGFIQKSKMSPQVANAVEGLSAGQYSKPFKSAVGLHIIKVDEVRGVREAVMEERMARAFRDWLQQLRENSFIEIRL